MKSAFSLMTFSFAIVAIWHCRSEPHSRFLKGTVTFLKDFTPCLLLNGFYYFVISQKQVNLIKSRYLEPRWRVQITHFYCRKNRRLNTHAIKKSTVMCYSFFHGVLQNIDALFSGTCCVQVLAAFPCETEPYEVCRVSFSAWWESLYLALFTRHMLWNTGCQLLDTIVSSATSASYTVHKRQCFKNSQDHRIVEWFGF